MCFETELPTLIQRLILCCLESCFSAQPPCDPFSYIWYWRLENSRLEIKFHLCGPAPMTHGVTENRVSFTASSSSESCCFFFFSFWKWVGIIQWRLIAGPGLARIWALVLFCSHVLAQRTVWWAPAWLKVDEACRLCQAPTAAAGLGVGAALQEPTRMLVRCLLWEQQPWQGRKGASQRDFPLGLPFFFFFPLCKCEKIEQQNLFIFYYFF